MSIFNELLPKICEISKQITKNFDDQLKAAFECFDKFEEEFQNGKSRAREAQKDKNAVTTLQRINEDEDETVKSNDRTHSSDRVSTDSTDRRGSKKRSKHEVDGIESPEVEKRQKRNASVKAQSIISKQVNVNLTQKMRREGSIDKPGKGRRKKDDDKENAEPDPVPVIQIKQEKISIPAEPMDVEAVPMKIEPVDKMTMPPPAAPVPKPRKGQKEKEKDADTSEEEGSRRRTTRTRKQTDTLPAPTASSRSTRASSRATKQNEEEVPPPEARPKRTRAKKVAETPAADSEKESQPESVTASPAEKPRPKRTRRVQKAAEKEPEKEIEKTQEIQKESDNQEQISEATIQLISPKKERISQPVTETIVQSPILQKVTKINDKTKTNDKSKNNDKLITPVNDIEEISSAKEVEDAILDKTKVISTENVGLDTTVVLPNGVYNHAPVTPKNVRQMNETVVLEKCNETVILDKPQTNVIMDATVVIEKNADAKAPNLTDDNSLLTDDSDSIEQTPPKQPPLQQPTSAVKEKVQQFEEMASRVTRTKTRAMAKKEEPTETQTPPDKVSKAILSSETLTKMNSMIFNGKAPQISQSATKPRANTIKTMIPSSTSKLSGIRAKEEERREKEDARRKKEALLEAKREMQKKKREDKMAAAAAAREAAEKERRALLQAAARERLEKQAHADLGKLERLKEVERRKQELARKVAETEERRRAEESARQQRLADEQRRAGERQRQLEEAEAVKKEAAIMARDIERRQREFMEKQKMKQRMEGDKILTPLKTINGHPPMEPVYMADGFQYLNSDEDEEPVERVPPTWSTCKARRQQLYIQARIASQHIDKLFSVREHTPDLQEIFPNIEKNRLKRTSSAVWRTPPRLPVLKE